MTGTTGEDTFVMPSAWLRVRYARRGGAGVAARPPAARAQAAALELVATHRAVVDRSLAGPGTDPEIVAAARAWLAGGPDAGPAGAAAVAAVCTGSAPRPGGAAVAGFADLWRARHGLPFAVRAATEPARTVAWPVGPAGHIVMERRGGDVRRIRRVMFPRHEDVTAALPVLGAVRAALAAAPDDRHAEAVAALVPYRGDGLAARVFTSFLAPAQTSWVDEDCAAVAAARDGLLASVLCAAVGSPEQADRVAGVASTFVVCESMPLLTSFVEGLGPAAADRLTTWFDQSGDGTVRRRLATLLAALPGDGPFRRVLERLDDHHVRPAVAQLAQRFPRRAVRLLADAAHPAAPDLLRAHVAARPDVARAVLPELTAAAAQRVRAALDDTAATPPTAADAAPTPPTAADAAPTPPAASEEMIP